MDAPSRERRGSRLLLFPADGDHNPTIFNMGHYDDDPDSSRASGAWLDVRSP